MTTRIELTEQFLTAPSLEGFATSALLEFYNAYQDRPLKAFRNRAQAEQRVLDLIAEIEGGGSDEEPVEAEPSLLGSLVQQVVEPAAVAEPEPEAPTVVTLADLCAELQVVPRIARRRLRKALGTLTEGRWEWDIEDEQLLGTIRGIISARTSTTTQGE